MFQFGDKGKMCLVRFLNSTVMVRVGGGWVTLAEFLEGNDPCRGMIHTQYGYLDVSKLSYHLSICNHFYTQCMWPLYF